MNPKKINLAAVTTLVPTEDHNSSSAFNYDMIVFSHLRWDFVYQRPQHLISRVSKEYRVLFIEEPVGSMNASSIGFNLEIISPDLHILKPRVNSISEIKEILKNLGITKIPVAWFYSSAFIEILDELDADTIIYDCMDELSLFKGASKDLRTKEKELIKMADLIMTGGFSLFEEKSKFSDHVYCFPSSVDCQHFNKGSNINFIPEELMLFENPIIGYIGVIDERIDMDLLKETAALLPTYEFIMIGPIVKIGERDLAKAENIHYLGMKDYKDLPFYLSNFEIAFMPFALNDATKFISPTKTLEYMAAGRPIISTAITDVVRQYNDYVEIVDSAETFKKAVEKIMLEENEKNYAASYHDILDATSWDHTAAAMLDLIKTTV